MRKTSTPLPTEQQRLEAALKRFQEELAKQPEISDEDFMAEFEVSDEEYEQGLALAITLSDTGDADKEDNV